MTKEEIIEQLISEAMVECRICVKPFVPINAANWVCLDCRRKAISGRIRQATQ